MALSVLEVLQQRYNRLDPQDIEVIHSDVEYSDKGELKYLLFEMNVKNGNGETRLYKAVKLHRLIRVPKNTKLLKSFMDMQADVISGLYRTNINFIQIIANILKPKPIGLLYMYGIQSVSSESMEEAKRMADTDFAAMARAFGGTFRTMEMRVPSYEEAEWLRAKMHAMKHVQVVRGLPATRKNPGDFNNSTMSGTGNSETEEQTEEFIAGMSDYEYIAILMATPIEEKTLSQWLTVLSKDQTKWEGLLQGSKGLNFGLSLPMIYMANLGATEGWNSSFSQGSSESHSDSTSLTNTVGTSQGITHTAGTTVTDGVSVSEGHSQSIGISHETGSGITDTDGVSTSHQAGVNASVSDSTSSGINQSHSVGENWSETDGTSRSTGSNWSESDGTSKTITDGTSHSKGTSWNETEGTSRTVTEGTSQSKGTNWSESKGTTHTVTDGKSKSVSSNWSHSESSSVSKGTSSSTSHSSTWNTSSTHGSSRSSGGSYGQSYSQSWGSSETQGTSHTDGFSRGGSAGIWGIGGRMDWSDSDTESSSYSQNHSSGRSSSGSVNWSGSVSNSETTGHGGGTTRTSGSSYTSTHGVTDTKGGGVTNTTSHSVSNSTSHTQTHGGSLTNTISRSVSDGVSHSFSRGGSETNTTSHSVSNSTSHTSTIGGSLTDTTSHSASRGGSIQNTAGISQSWTSGQSFGANESWGTGISQSQSLSQNQSQGFSASESVSRQASASHSVSQSQSLSKSFSENQSVSRGLTHSDGWGLNRGQTQGFSGALNTGTSGTMGIGPSLSWSKMYQWKDIEVENILKLLEFQRTRLIKATNGQGAFFVDFFIATENEKARSAAKALATSAWLNDEAYVSPLQVLTLPKHEEQHLLYHLNAFSPCLTKEGIPGQLESYKYSTVLLSSELAAYSHPPRISEGGLYAEVDDMPTLAVPSNRQDGEIFVGHILSGERYSPERGYLTDFQFRIRESEIMHAFFQGGSRSGKTVAATRVIAELANNVRRGPYKKRMRVVVLDPKKDWRVLARFVEPQRFRFYSLADPLFCPIKLNLARVPRGVYTERYMNSIVEVFCRAFGLGERGKQILTRAFYEEYTKAGCFKGDGKQFAHERSANVTLETIYRNLENKKAEMDDPKAKVKYGNDARDAFTRVMDRIESFGRIGSINHTMFCNQGGMSIDEILGADDVVVLESYGLESTTRSFVFGLITSAIFQYCVHNGGFVKPKNQYETVLVIEEANEVLIGQDSAAKDGNNSVLSGPSEFERILDQAAGNGLFIWAITQKISQLPKSIIANCGIVFAGRTKIPDDINIVVRQIGREERYDDRPLVKWFPRCPTGWFVVQTSRTFDFKDAEPCLVKIEPLAVLPPEDEELEQIINLGVVARKMVNKEIENLTVV